MAGGHVRGDTARPTRGDAAKGIRCGEGRQIRSRGRPAGQHGRLRQQQHEGHGRHDHQCQSCGQDRPGTAFASITRSRPAADRGAIPARDCGMVPPGGMLQDPGWVALPHDVMPAFSDSHHLAARPCAGPPTAPVPLPAPVHAVSLRAAARAVSVQGMDAPNGPGTRSVTVTLNHSPSAATDAAAEPPASVLTVLSTAAGSSPRASALAPARAPSSMRSCVIPAAAPASSMAISASTAGSATANSAVTAPCAFAPEPAGPLPPLPPAMLPVPSSRELAFRFQPSKVLVSTAVASTDL